MPVLDPAPAPPDVAAAWFAARLAVQTDVADVATALASPDPGFVLVDSRGDAAWAAGYVPGAVHLPTAQLAARAPTELDAGVPVVTYCWGPGCDGAARAALVLARLGFAVKEMIGGFEYWVREGLPVATADGVRHGVADPLTAPVAVARAAIGCDC